MTPLPLWSSGLGSSGSRTQLPDTAELSRLHNFALSVTLAWSASPPWPGQLHSLSVFSSCPASSMTPPNASLNPKPFLQLHKHQGTRAIYCHRVVKSWGELLVQWSSCPCSPGSLWWSPWVLGCRVEKDGRLCPAPRTACQRSVASCLVLRRRIWHLFTDISWSSGSQLVGDVTTRPCHQQLMLRNYTVQLRKHKNQKSRESRYFK